MSRETERANEIRKSAIDWTALRRRLQSTTMTFGQTATPSPEQTRRILRARAALLARMPQHETGEEEHLEILEFLLTHEWYAVEASSVREVYSLRELTTLPGTPAFVAGIINVRGQIVSVVDLKKFFDLPEKGLTDLNKVIILSNAEMEFGLLVDAVVGVRRIPLSEIQPSLPTLTGVRQEYLRGVTGERLVILDAARLLADPTIIVCTQVQAQVPVERSRERKQES